MTLLYRDRVYEFSNIGDRILLHRVRLIIKHHDSVLPFQLRNFLSHLNPLISHPLQLSFHVDGPLLFFLCCFLVARAVLLESLAYLSHLLQLLKQLFFLHVQLKSFGFFDLELAFQIDNDFFVGIANCELLRNLLVDLFEFSVLDLKPHVEIMGHLFLRSVSDLDQFLIQIS